MTANFTAYADFDFRDTPDAEFLVSRLFSGVHASIVQECGDEGACRQTVIAVTFPHAARSHGDDGEPCGYHGGALRVFAQDTAVLGRLTRHPAVHRFVAGGKVGIKAVENADEMESQLRFCRNRRPDKASPSARRREAERAIALNKPKRSDQLRAAKRKGHGKVEDGLSFSIEIVSHSTGNEFLLHVRHDDGCAPGVFNAYGLVAGRSAA